MQTRLHYTAIGVFVVVFVTALIIIGLWLSIGLSKKPYETYMVIMKESVSGLTDKAPVKYNGVTVGTVSEMKLNLQDPQEVRLLLQIDEGTPITTATTAILTSQGITGVAYINLKGGPAGSPPLMPGPNQPYPLIKSAPSLMFRIDAIVTQMSTDFDKISLAINKIVSPQNQAAFTKLLQNTAIASEQFPHLAQKIDSASAETTKTMKSGDETLLRFNQQTLPSADTALSELEEITHQLSSVAQDLKQNPSILIRGKAPAPPGPGE
jgi:phospholipid/cholesterol/gamma-HCH transport system substrate-binding protein